MSKKKKIIPLVLALILLFAVAVFTDPFPEEEEEDFGEVSADFVCGEDYDDPRDGKSYSTVEVDDFCWFAENLRYEGINSEIDRLDDRNDWEEAGRDRPAYAVYGNDSKSASRYGNLYNWAAVEKVDLCPQDWEVPKSADWHRLESFLAEENCNRDRRGSFDCQPAGSKMKGVYDGPASAGWNGTFNCESDEIDCIGFEALPTGSRYESGTYFGLGSRSYFWASGPAPLFYGLRDDRDGVLRNDTRPGMGMAVRCVLKMERD